MDTNKHEWEYGVRGNVTPLLMKEEVYKIVGAAMEVHTQLGAGFLEAVYQEALEIELREHLIPFRPQQPIPVRYKNHLLKKEYIADLVCFGTVLVEIKALEKTGNREMAQVLNYLKATQYKVGVLLNFGDPSRLDWKRYVL